MIQNIEIIIDIIQWGITASKDDIYGISKGGKNNKSRRLSRKTKITSCY